LVHIVAKRDNKFGLRRVHVAAPSETE
jgi:hypothetical protein